MFRTLLRAVLVIIIVAAVAAFFIGYQFADRDDLGTPNAVGTTGTAVDVSTARDAGAEIAEKVAVGANAAQRIASSMALTAKIKSKMALDDHVKGRAINVDTSGSVVTMTGVVASANERDRALRLARDTDGVTQVVDRLHIDKP